MRRLISARRLIVLLASTLILRATAQAQTTWYVDDDAAPSGNGTNWLSAFTYLQDALAAAAEGDEIRVAGGTYNPDRDEGGNVTPGDRDATFQMISAVGLYGAYAGLADPDHPDHRDIDLYESRLNGDLNGDDDPNDPTTVWDNSNHVVTGSGTDGTAVLDGFTITGGNARTGDECGGGMFNEAGSPTVTDCTFERNCADHYGGGIYNGNDSSPTLTDCAFSENWADVGGGMSNWESSSPTVIGCSFTDNRAFGGAGMANYYSSPMVASCSFVANTAWDGSGGGMNNWESSPAVANCTFSANWALYDGGGVTNWESSPTVTNCTFSANLALEGGGMRSASNSSPIVSDCTFSENEAVAGGGGMFNHGGSPTVANCTFSANWALYDGGGVTNWESSPTVTNCTFIWNSADYYYRAGGGGMSNWESSPTVANCTFTANWHLTGGGGMGNSGSSPTVANCSFTLNGASNFGGAMSNEGGSPTLTNCTFTGNWADEYGGAMHNDGASPTVANGTFSANGAGDYGGAISNDGGSPTVTNCILWGDSPDEIVDGSESATTVCYSDVQGGWPGDGNIDADPLFVDPNNGDYHVSPGSPCVDAGDNDAVPADTLDLDGDGDTTEPIPIDLDGRLRFADRLATLDTGNPGVPGPPIVDMGAYEYQCDGDLDGDGDIDLSDLAQLLSNYGTTSGACYADGDLDGDGDVDLDDLAALLAVYGTECTMAGNNCNNPLQITLSSQDLPYAEVNTTCGRGNDYEGTCLSDFDTGEDLIYELTILETMEVDIVVNPYDAFWTAVAVSDTCPPGDTCLAYTCGYSDVRIIPSLVLDPGVYYVMVDSQAPDCIDELTLIIRDALPCDTDCPPGADLESEACGEDLNGGCGAIPPAFEPITCGETVCGTIWAEDYMRDTDWYEVTTTEATRFTWHIVSEFPAVIGLVETDPPGSGDCWDMTGYLNPWDIDSACANATITTDLLPPGTYWFYVSHNEFYCDPCGQKNDYVATLTCETLSGPGDDCSDPVVVTLSNDSLPRAVLGTTCGRGNDYEDTCLEQWDGGEDFICEVHVTEEMVITIVLGTFDTGWTGVAIDDTCPPGNSCLAYSTAGDNEYWQHTEMVHLVPGTYYVIVDTWPSPDCIPVFELIFDYPPP